ncbi:MAG: hypothetical protein JYX80_10795 [Candidatus Scalindua sediminis]|nr:hypothetical protein [Candidatus Scalindua sediminis]HDY68671.1 hypothetical protein [Candidatus Scalindua sp.]
MTRKTELNLPDLYLPICPSAADIHVKAVSKIPAIGMVAHIIKNCELVITFYEVVQKGSKVKKKAKV